MEASIACLVKIRRDVLFRSPRANARCRGLSLPLTPNQKCEPVVQLTRKKRASFETKYLYRKALGIGSVRYIFGGAKKSSVILSVIRPSGTSAKTLSPRQTIGMVLALLSIGILVAGRGNRNGQT